VYFLNFLLVVCGVGLIIYGISEDFNAKPQQFDDFDKFAYHSSTFFIVSAFGGLTFFFAVANFGYTFSNTQLLNSLQDLPLDGRYGTINAVLWNLLPPESRARMLRRRQITMVVMIIVVFIIQVALAVCIYQRWGRWGEQHTDHNLSGHNFQWPSDINQAIYTNRRNESKQITTSTIAPYMIFCVLVMELIVMVASVFTSLSIRHGNSHQEAQLPRT